MGEIFFFWAKSLRLESEKHACQVVEVRPPFKDMIFVLHIMQYDHKEAFWS